ncbi:uncharacterized protein KZ484_022305 [Pholidichthys leucotaenia]
MASTLSGKGFTENNLETEKIPSKQQFSWSNNSGQRRMQAGSEGELFPADSLGSAGSNSTLASSVIEVEAEQAILTPRLQASQEEEEVEEEELTTLSPPPTLSITEEILEFINQSRAREGLTAVHANTVEKVQDEPKESLLDQINFSCPLPPVAVTYSPEEEPALQQEQEKEEMDSATALQSPMGENETVVNEVQEDPDKTSYIQNGVVEEVVMDNDKEQKKTSDDEAGNSIIPSSSSLDLHSSIIAEGHSKNGHLLREEADTCISNPDVCHHPIQRQPPATRISHLTKRDKKIIEKIRSYYEAAAEEAEAEDEDELKDGTGSRRRNSFSHIPSGLVKESVSKFNMGETDSGPSRYEGTEALDRETLKETESCSSTGTVSSPPLRSRDAGGNGQADTPISSLDSTDRVEEDSNKSAASTVVPEKDTPSQVVQSLMSHQNKPAEKTEIPDRNGNICKRSLEEKTEEKDNVVDTEDQNGTSPEGEGPSTTKEYQHRGEANQEGLINQAIVNGHAGPEKTNGSQKEPSTPLKSEPKNHNSWSISKNPAKTIVSLESLPSQIKVGRWSRPSRIVTDNRALFEGMASDVAGIGLFEASPAVDPVLMENSDRILSKVQTLARMYSAKASTMKVPLHQKRASTIRNQSCVSARFSGFSTQTPVQSQAQMWQRETSQSDIHTKIKCGTQTNSETQTTEQINLQSEICIKAQSYTGTCSQTQLLSIETKIIQEESLPKRTVSLTEDFQKTLLSPCEPSLFNHVLVREQITPPHHQQTNGVTLSRPRDFISALTKERDIVLSSSSSENLETAVPSRESPCTIPTYQSTSQVQTNGYNPGYNSVEASTMTFNYKFKDVTDSSARSGKANMDPVSEVKQKLDGLEQSGELLLNTQLALLEPSLIKSTRKMHKGLDGAKPAVQDEEFSVSSVHEKNVCFVTKPKEQSPSEYTTSMVPPPEQGGEKAPNETADPGEEGPITLGTFDNPVKENLSDQTLASFDFVDESLQSSGVPPSDLTPGPSQDCSQSVTEIQEAPKAREEVSVWTSDPCSSRPSTPPSDGPPTLTCQKLSELNKNGPRDSWNKRPEEPGSGSPACALISSTSNLDPSQNNPSSDKQDSDPSLVISAFKPNLAQSSPSTPTVRKSPGPSPFRIIPASSPVPVASASTALSCLSPTKTPIAPSPTPSAVFTPSSSSGHSSRLACPSPFASSSAFTRSFAASCISQSISQSMEKDSTSRQHGPLSSTVDQSPSSHLRWRSPSPKLHPSHQLGTNTPAYSQLGCTKDGYQYPRCPPSTLRSSCPSPSLSRRSPSPSSSPAHPQLPHSPSPRPSFLHSKVSAPQNSNHNNNNNAVTSRVNGALSGLSASPQRSELSNGSTQPSHDPHWLGSHNRVARPFSASEPSSRVQSPSPSPTPASFTRLCSPPLHHNYTSPHANKPPNPRSTKVGGASSHNPLGLTLQIPAASISSSTFGSQSPQILSPPPIGISVNVWTNNVAAPQPRNPRYASTSPSSSFSSTMGSSAHEMSSFPTSSFVTRSASRAPSPSGSCPAVSQSLRRSLSSSLADRPPSLARTNAGAFRRSWADGSRRSLGFVGNSSGSFDQQESCLTSPRSGWSSYGSSPSCISPQTGVQSPFFPARLTTGKSNLSRQHFTSVPWPDVRELSSKYNGRDSPNSDVSISSPAPISQSHPLITSSQTHWGDPELEEGTCRSQLICAYVARPSCKQNLTSSCLVLSPSEPTSPPSSPYQHHNHLLEPQIATTTTPAPPVAPPFQAKSPPLHFPPSSPTKQGTQRTSYATTVNLQIAGSGRITSFSTAQVSLTQTLQGGTGAAGGQGQVVRRVSINGLSHPPSPPS